MEKLSKADLEKEAILNPEKAEKKKTNEAQGAFDGSYNRIVCFLCGLYDWFYGSPGHGKKQHYE